MLICFSLKFKTLIYIPLTVLVSVMFYANSAGVLFRLVQSNRSLIILIMEFIHIFQYGEISNKMTFSNVNLLNKVFLIVVLVFLKVKIRNVFHCNISSEDLLKLNYFKSYLCLPNKKVFNFLTVYLSLLIFFVFIWNAYFLILCCIIHTSYHNSFLSIQFIWDCANGFVNIFNVHYDFNVTNNYIRFLNFTYSFIENNVDVSYDGSRNFSELRDKSNPGSNGVNKNAILIFLFLTRSFFHYLIKPKPNVRVKIIPLAVFFFIGCSVKHLQHPTLYHDIHVCS